FTLGCHAFALVTFDSECRVDFIYGSEKHPSAHSEICPVRKNNREERIMLKIARHSAVFRRETFPRRKNSMLEHSTWTLRNLTACSRCGSPVAIMFSFIQSPTMFQPPLRF